MVSPEKKPQLPLPTFYTHISHSETSNHSNHASNSETWWEGVNSYQ